MGEEEVRVSGNPSSVTFLQVGFRFGCKMSSASKPTARSIQAHAIYKRHSTGIALTFCQRFLLATFLLVASAINTKCAQGIAPPLSETEASAEPLSPKKAWLENLIADEIIQKYLNSEVLPSMLSDQRTVKDAAAKRFSEFVGKRFSEFVGKRNPEEKRFSEFVGKRSPDEKRFSEFVGKRTPLDKRFSEFVGKRFSEFVGKRSGDNDEKRFSEFVGK